MYQKLSKLYCKKCSEVFNDESELADHIMGEHSPEEKSVNLTCEKCFGIEFTKKEDLLQHMLTNHIKTVSMGELENNDEKTTRRQKLQAYEAAQSYFAQPEKSPSIEIDPSTIIQIDDRIYTGKSLSEALILASTNPQYDKKLFIDLPVQFMKTTSSEHVLSW